MTFGLVLMDLVYFVGLAGIALGSSAGALAAWEALVSAGVAAPAALALAAFAFGAIWVLLPCLIAMLLPRVRPGRHALQSPAFLVWILRMCLFRYLNVPPMWLIVRHSNLLRTAVYRALGAKLGLSTSMSPDAVVLDPGLLALGPGTIIGSGALVSGHYMTDRHLKLDPIRIGRSVVIATQAIVSLGADLGDRVKVGPRAMVGPGARVGADATVGPGAAIGARAVVGEGSDIGMFALLGTGCRLGKGVKVIARGEVPPGTVLPDGATWTSQLAADARRGSSGSPESDGSEAAES